MRQPLKLNTSVEGLGQASRARTICLNAFSEGSTQLAEKAVARGRRPPAPLRVNAGLNPSRAIVPVQCCPALALAQAIERT